MKHKFASKFVVLFVLLALMFSAVGTAPAQAVDAYETTAPWSTNLLANPGAETNDLSGWNIILNDGDGWGIADPGHQGSHSFITSYSQYGGWDTRYQEIDLLAAGFTAEELDLAPRVAVGEWFKGFDCDGGCNPADKYYFKVELRDAEHAPIASWNAGSMAAPLIATASWTEQAHTFSGYGSGLRYIYLEDGGTDVENWGGHFGAMLDDAYVTVLDNFLYVKSDGVGDCLSWVNACDLQTALTNALSGEEIWVAAGTYKPTNGTDRAATFQLKDGVDVYGGFPNTGEPVFNDRDPVNHPSILSGDLAGNDNVNVNIDEATRSENSYHVVTSDTGTARLDGFTITGGNANGASANHYHFGGGIIGYYGTSFVFSNLIVRDNSGQYGGGSYNYSNAVPLFINSTFHGNSANYGGGMYNSGGNPSVVNVTFYNNSAASAGGGMLNDFSTAQITNVTFSGNSSVQGGGMLNTATSALQIRNSIFWQNSAPISSQLNGYAAVDNSVVQDGFASGTNIITTDPLLGTPDNYGGFTPTIPLLAGSSAIDTGNDTVCQAAVDTPDYGAGGLDQRGVARPQGAHCDIGAFELEVYTLTYTAGANGTITGASSQTVNHGADGSEVTAVSDTGYHFVSWSDGILTASRTDTNVTDDITVTANFAINSYNLTYTAGANGSITGTSPQTVNHGASGTPVTAVPNTGYRFVKWSDNSTANPRTDTNVTGNISVTVAFALNNQPPTNITLSASSVNENQPVGTTVGTLITTDPSAGDTHTYSFCGGTSDASFSIAGASLKTAAVFDYETKNSYAICIRTTDSGGLTFNKNFTITVNNVIETVSVTFRSTGAQDGWVLESGENTNVGKTINGSATTLRLGDDAAKKQYRSVLSFATGATLPDNAVITKITLKVKRQALIGGGNPVAIFQGFMVDIRKGIFGTSALQSTDWQAAPSKTYGPFNTALVSGWYSIDLTAGKAYINKLATLSGLTQIRLRFKLDDNNNAIANYLSVYSGNAPAASRPQLIVEYRLP